MIGLSLLLALGFAGLLAPAFDTDEPHASDDDDPPVDPPNDDQYGTEGADSLEGGGGGDRIFGRGGDDWISGFSGNNWLRGGDGNDTLSGGMARDTLMGDEGDDELRGGSGNDSLIGGIGNDTLVAGYGADTLLGGEGNDRLLGYQRGHMNNGGYDLLDGGEGHDTLATGVGATNCTLIGGNGNDTFYVNGAGNLIVAGNGADYIVTGLGNTIDLGGETDGAAQDILSIDASDTSAGPLVISGFDSVGAGNATTEDRIELHHMPGRGVTLTDDGDDLLISSGGVTLIRLTGLAGASLEDVLPGMRFEHGFVSSGTDADESFVDGYGDDQISGMGGNDSIYSYYGEDTILGGDGNDDLRGARFAETGDYDDYVTQPLTDAAVFDGGAGDDTLTGENGDTLTGGAGNDLFIVNAYNEGQVTVTDFTSGEDRLGFLASYSIFEGPVTLDWTGGSTYLEQEVLADGSGLMVTFFDRGEEQVSVLLEGVSDTLPADQLLATDADTLGTSGNDTLVFEEPVYWEGGGLFGLAGDDVLYADAPDDWSDSNDDVILAGGLGNDTLYAGQSEYACLDGGEGDDLLYSGAVLAPDGTGGTTPVQTELSANLSGGNGNDTLVASASDRVSGGAGLDRFEICGDYAEDHLFRYGKDETLITDFEAGEQIVLTDPFGAPMTDLFTQVLTDEGLRIFVPGANFEGVFLPGMTRLLTPAELPQAYS